MAFKLTRNNFTLISFIFIFFLRRESRNVTNNLLDFNDFDVINTNNMISDSTVSPQILDLQVGKDNYNNSKDLTGTFCEFSLLLCIRNR